MFCEGSLVEKSVSQNVTLVLARLLRFVHNAEKIRRVNMGSVTLGRGWWSVHLHPAGQSPTPVSTADPDWTWRPLGASAMNQLRPHLRVLAGAGDGRRQLRQLLADMDDFDVSRLSDAHLVDLIAAMVGASRLTMYERVLTDEAQARYGIQRRVGARYSDAEPAMTPSQRSSRSETPPSTTPTEETLPEADLAQDAQAATLKAAAEQGVPFCEVCAKASAARSPAPTAMAA